MSVSLTMDIIVLLVAIIVNTVSTPL